MSKNKSRHYTRERIIILCSKTFSTSSDDFTPFCRGCSCTSTNVSSENRASCWRMTRFFGCSRARKRENYYRADYSREKRFARIHHDRSLSIRKRETQAKSVAGTYCVYFLPCGGARRPTIIYIGEIARTWIQKWGSGQTSTFFSKKINKQGEKVINLC